MMVKFYVVPLPSVYGTVQSGEYVQCRQMRDERMLSRLSLVIKSPLLFLSCRVLAPSDRLVLETHFT